MSRIKKGGSSRQVTLIAFYNNLPENLGSLLEFIIGRIKELMGKKFEEYGLPESNFNGENSKGLVHSTIIGMERVTDNEGIIDERFINQNLFKKNKFSKQTERMIFDGLVDFIDGRLPLQLQFGGFENINCGYWTFGMNPYKASFSLQPEKDKITKNYKARAAFLCGIPLDHKGGINKKPLFNFREDLCNKFNIRAKFADDGDNESSMTLGRLLGKEFESDENETKKKIEADIREHMRTNKIIVPLERENIFFASYIDETLPQATTKIIKFTDLMNIEDQRAYIEALYNERV